MQYISSNPLPALLRHFRTKLNLTQAEVAKTISISRSAYGNYEQGRAIPTIEQTIKLSDLLQHDLLYAYTLSSRYMKLHGGNNSEGVNEDNNYVTSVEESIFTSQLLVNYKKLSDVDKTLVNSFVELLCDKKQYINEEEHTDERCE
ncbi:MAG: helix-turn-helix transcriptional regulator [Coprococcus sp.]|nr:helix-turn-helix transcriptional regulator [Coprococcus sp.]